MATATVNYRAEIADLRAKLASIPDVTRAEARKMVTELNRSMRAVEKANKAAAASVSSANRQIQTGARANAAAMAQTTAAANRMANASRSVAMQLPDVASQLAAGTPAMTVFTQQGLQVVQMNMQLVESGAKRMGLSLGSIGPIALAVAPAVVALGAVYVVLSRQLEEAEARAASFARGSKALGDAHTKLTRETTAVELELAKLTGTLDEVTAAQERRDRTIRQAAEAERRAAAVVVEQAKQRLRQADGIEEVQAAEAGLARARQQHSRIIAGANTRERTALEQSAQIVEYTRERAASEETLRQREEARAKATAEAAKRDAELLRLMREREAASNQLGAITARSTLVVLEGEARLREEYRRQMSQIDELEATSRDHINADVARAAVREELEKRLTDLRERNAAKAAAAERRSIQETERARQQAMQESMQLAGQMAGVVSDGAQATYQASVDNLTKLQDYQQAASEHLTARQREQLDQRVQDQRRAARNAFDASQAAAAAEAAVQTALAVSKALASAPPPFNFVLAGTAAAAGVAQQAAIMRAQPAFHQGGPVDMAPDEVQAVVRQREFVLNPTGREMMGDADLTRANAGQSPRGGDVVAVSVYKHTRQVDRWKRDGLNAGDPIARAIDRGRLVGHRSNR